ncbi:hypothetical protein [Sphingopyxis sp. PET50]|uniref:hypothetical protein n=1 Tax=Sphingopyxis sp. PET50 TaxID=2976533 RepID=UPI0021AF57D4|nr:hypothetical protein [Sphingopyxis sp. PET50]
MADMTATVGRPPVVVHFGENTAEAIRQRQLIEAMLEDEGINDVAENIENINAVADSIADVGAVADDLSGANTIGAIAPNIADVAIVGGNIDNVIAAAGAVDDMAAIVPALPDIAEVAATSGLAHPFDLVPNEQKPAAFRFLSDDKFSLGTIYNDGSWNLTLDEASGAYLQVKAMVEAAGFVDAHPFDRPSAGGSVEGSPQPSVTGLMIRSADGKALFGVDGTGAFYIGSYDRRIAAAVTFAESASAKPTLPLVREESDQIVAYYGSSTEILTDEGNNRSPSIVGNEILFFSDRFRGALAPYRMNLDGSDQRALLRDVTMFAFGQQGQSNSRSPVSSPAITTTPPHPGVALMLSGGPVFSGATSSPSAVFTDLQSDNSVETVAPSYVASIVDQQAADYPEQKFVAFGNGNPGIDYAGLKKGTAAYNDILAQTARIVALGGNVVVPGFVILHGEADATSTTYDLMLTEWQSDTETDVQAITGQKEPVYFFVTQIAAGTVSGLRSRLGQLKASVNNDKIVLVGPDYIFEYVDDLHFTPDGNRLKGEYIEKAIRAVIFEGRDWRGVSPRSFMLGSDYVDVRFWVPVEPLVLDTALCTDPGNYGFTYSDAAGRTISSVAVQSSDTIRVTLSGAIGATAILSYAYDNRTDTHSGPTDGARGCLRDSDPALSRWDGTTHLYNAGAIFSQALN